MTEPLDVPDESPRSRARIRLAAAAALVLIFVAGAAAGWGMSTRMHEQTRRGRPGSGRPRGAMVAYFERLHLRPEQKTAIDSIFARRRVEIDAFWRGPGQQLRAILDSTRADVRSVLDSAQRATYDSLPDPSRRGPGGPGRPGGRDDRNDRNDRARTPGA